MPQLKSWLGLSLGTVVGLVTVGPFAAADSFNAEQIANSIYQASQQQSAQQEPQGPTSSGDNSAGSGPINSQPVRSAPVNSGNADPGLSSNNVDNWTPAGSGDGAIANRPSPRRSTVDDGANNDDDARSTANSVNNRRAPALSAKQKAAIRAANYLAKVKTELRLKEIKNNDGGAWDLKHAYENQLRVIQNGSRTAQARALQVQLSGELQQLQAVHDRRVAVFNHQIDQLANAHATDKQAIDLQDAIDYEDSQLSRKQLAARKSYLKQLRAINPVKVRTAKAAAKKAYQHELKAKGLVDPDRLVAENQRTLKQAEVKAQVMQDDY